MSPRPAIGSAGSRESICMMVSLRHWPGSAFMAVGESDRPGTPLRLVTAANDAYALGAAVMLRSAADHLASGASIEAFLVAARLAAPLRTRIEASVRGLPIRLHWILQGDEAIDFLPSVAHLSREAYHRLQLTDLLPS